MTSSIFSSIKGHVAQFEKIANFPLPAKLLLLSWLFLSSILYITSNTASLQRRELTELFITTQQQQPSLSSSPDSPCACDQSSTHQPVCGQYLASSANKSDFVCFIANPKSCISSTSSLSPSIKITTINDGDAYKNCTHNDFPTVATLLSQTDQACTFTSLLQLANYTSIDVEKITLFIPSNEALTSIYATAIGNNHNNNNDDTGGGEGGETATTAATTLFLTKEQLQFIIKAHIILIPLTQVELVPLTLLTTTTGSAITINATRETGQVYLGQRNVTNATSTTNGGGRLTAGANVIIGDLLAQDGVVHIIDSPLVTLESLTLLVPSDKDENSTTTGTIVDDDDDVLEETTMALMMAPVTESLELPLPVSVVRGIAPGLFVAHPYDDSGSGGRDSGGLLGGGGSGDNDVESLLYGGSNIRVSVTTDPGRGPRTLVPPLIKNEDKDVGEGDWMVLAPQMEEEDKEELPPLLPQLLPELLGARR